MALEPGHVLNFDHPVTKPLRLVVNGQNKYEGGLVAMRNKKGRSSITAAPHGILPRFDEKDNSKPCELVNLVPLHPVTLQTGYLVGQIEGRREA